MTLRSALLRWRAAPLLVALCTTAAHAEPLAEPSAEAPPAAEREARALFASANEHFANNQFPRAIELYKAALARWEQPIIHFNLAVTLIELGRSREAYHHLQQALANSAALGERSSEARNYLRLLRARLSTIALSCPPHATCELDGQRIGQDGELLTLEPGSHTLAARGAGYESLSQTLVLEPGAHRELRVQLRRPRALLVRRWASWKPWTVVATGLAATGGGVTLALWGRQRVDRAQAQLARDCAAGCADGAPPHVTELSERGERAQAIGVGTALAGGAVLLAGAILVVLNQPVAKPRPHLAFGVAPLTRGALATWEGTW